MSLDNTFVVEVCQGCKSHNWNNRHDENKYNSFYAQGKKMTFLTRDLVAAAIQDMCPGAKVLKN